MPAPDAGPWRFWATTAWGLAMMVAGMAAGVAAAFVLSWLDPASSSADDLASVLARHPTAIIAGPAAGALVVLLLAVRLSRMDLRAYLGLILPRRVDVMIGVAGLVAVYALSLLVNHLAAATASSQWVVQIYRDAALLGGLPALALAIVILYPLSEELLFRGFLLPGWAASRLGPTGAILLTAATWTALHIQYDLAGLANVFCLGILFGWLRRRSGSTLLTIFLHAGQNGLAFGAIALHDWLAAGTA
jgi:membrane protease YdiL (CAAX protease family)